jgi:fructoselysine-6-P-deglycase FrlB-like protein
MSGAGERHEIERRAPESRAAAVTGAGTAPETEQRAPALAITNDAGSPLAGAATHVIPLQTGEEESVAATKTYTSSPARRTRSRASCGARTGSTRPRPPPRAGAASP